MYTINQTEEFDGWIESLRDLKGRSKVLVRIGRAALGNFGDVASVGDGIYEMRIDFGPGYRVYYAREDRDVYLLLTDGDKSTQPSDIKSAKAIWQQILKEQGTP